MRRRLGSFNVSTAKSMVTLPSGVASAPPAGTVRGGIILGNVGREVNQKVGNAQPAGGKDT